MERVMRLPFALERLPPVPYFGASSLARWSLNVDRLLKHMAESADPALRLPFPLADIRRLTLGTAKAVLKEFRHQMRLFVSGPRLVTQRRHLSLGTWHIPQMLEHKR